MTFMYAKANTLNDELGRMIHDEQIWLDSIEGQMHNLGNDPETQVLFPAGKRVNAINV